MPVDPGEPTRLMLRLRSPVSLPSIRRGQLNFAYVNVEIAPKDDSARRRVHTAVASGFEGNRRPVSSASGSVCESHFHPSPYTESQVVARKLGQLTSVGIVSVVI